MAQVEQTIPLQGEKEITVVTQIGGQNEIELYPNPTVDFLIVEIKNSEMKNVEFLIRSLNFDMGAISEGQTRNRNYDVTLLYC